MIAGGVGFLTIILAVWLWRADDRAWMRKLGFAALGAVVAQGVLGGLTVLLLLPPAVSIFHACLAQAFFTTVCCIALVTSPHWRRGAEPAIDSGWLNLKTVSLALPACVMGQLALGAAYRHQALGIVPHIAGALLVTGFALFLAVYTLLQCGWHRTLRVSAIAAMGATFFQVFLGVAAYMSRVSTADAPQPMPVMVWFTVAHVAVGALTLAAATLFTVQIRRHVITDRQVADVLHAVSR
jgi:cytochrome c oxidase assembly protein subunit 15